MSPDKTLQTVCEEEILIFTLSNNPPFMYAEDRFWVSLTHSWQNLGNIERAYLSSGEKIMLMNDHDCGTYVPLDSFLSMCPLALKTKLKAQKTKMVALMNGGE